MIVQSLADQVITSKMLKSFSKVVNCLLCPSMYDIVLDIQNDEIGYARNAYLSLIMVMPVNKNTSELNKKIKLCNKVKTSSFVPKYNEEIDE